MNEKMFLDTMKDILDDETVTMNSLLSDIEGWDSLSVINYRAMANTSFGKQIPPEQVHACSSIQDLYDLLIKD